MGVSGVHSRLSPSMPLVLSKGRFPLRPNRPSACYVGQSTGDPS
jgi:hypothetical protein